MKRIIISLLAILAFAFNGYCQLQTKTVQEAHQYKVVYKIPMNSGEIRYSNNYGYILFGSTNNRYEKSMASIFLGAEKENAILTLKDLQELKVKANEPLIVPGFMENETTIFLDPLNGKVFKTEHVAGHSFALIYTKYDKAIKAIEDFQE